MSSAEAAPLSGTVRCFMCGSSLRNEAALDKHVILCAKGHLDKKQQEDDDDATPCDQERQIADSGAPGSAQRGPVVDAPTVDANDDGALLSSSRDHTADASGSTTPPMEGDAANVFNADAELSTGASSSPKDTPGKRRRRRQTSGCATSATAAVDEDSSARRLQRTRLAEALQSLEEMQHANQERLREVQQQLSTPSGLTSPPHQGSSFAHAAPVDALVLPPHNLEEEGTAEGSGPGAANGVRSPPLSSSFASSGRRSIMFARHHSAKPQLASPPSPSTSAGVLHHVDPATKSDDPSATTTRRGGAASSGSMERCSSAVTIPSAVREDNEFRLRAVPAANRASDAPASPSSSRPVMQPQPVSPLLSSRALATSRVSTTALPGTSKEVRTRSTEARQPRRISSSPQPQRRSSTVAGRRVSGSSKHLDGTQSMNVSVELSRTGRSATASRQRSTEASAPSTLVGAAGSGGGRASVASGVAGRNSIVKPHPANPTASRYATQPSHYGHSRSTGTFSGRTPSHAHDGSTTQPTPLDSASASASRLVLASSAVSRRFRATPTTLSQDASRSHPTTGIAPAAAQATATSSGTQALAVHLTMSTGSLTISGPVPMPKHSSLRPPNRRVVPISAASPPHALGVHTAPAPAASGDKAPGRSSWVLPPPPKRASVSQPRSASPGHQEDRGHSLLDRGHGAGGGGVDVGGRGGGSSSRSPAAQYCTECGNRYVEGAKFCAFCGHRRETHLSRGVDETAAGSPELRSTSRVDVDGGSVEEELRTKEPVQAPVVAV